MGGALIGRCVDPPAPQRCDGEPYGGPYAGMYQIRSGMHGPTDVSPVGMAAALHLGLAIHNFGIQEYMPHGERTNRVFRQSVVWSDGLLHPGDEPGLGVDIDVDEAGRYPYQRAYLPFNRLADGTVHDW